MNRDDQTYGRIRRKYDEWIANEAARPDRDHLRRVDSIEPVPQQGTDMSRMVTATIGFGLAALLLAIAAYSFYSAGTWADVGRNGAQTGYTVVGVFLLIAGFGGLAATWNHNFRVLTRPPHDHH